MHAFMERRLVNLHSQHLKSVDTERILDEDEIVGRYAKTMIVRRTLVGLDACDDFRSFQGGFSFDVISSFHGGYLHDVVKGLSANRCHDVVNVTIAFLVRVSAGVY